MYGATYVHRLPGSGVYRFRRRVPDDLRAVIGCQEITRSLRTKSWEVAKQRTRRIADATDNLFEEAHRRLTVDAVNVSGWHDAWLKQHMLTETAPIEASGESLQLSPASQIPTQDIPALARTMTIDALEAKYLAEFPRRPRSVQATISTVELFLGLTGLNRQTPAHMIDDRHVEDFITRLRRLPARRQGEIFRGLSAFEISDRFASDTVHAKMDPKSIVIKVDTLRAMFYFGVRHRHLLTNPFVGKISKRSGRKAAEKKRLPFSREDLAMIFGQPIFRQPTDTWTGTQWLSVMALYTGARLEELGQLRLNDVQTRLGTAFLSLAETETAPGSGLRPKSLKTASSTREIPLHPVLVELGILRHRDRMREAKEARLFPTITSNGSELTAGYSKWFGRFLTKIGITNPMKVFHSYRHTFKDGCRDNAVSREIAETIMGHAGRTVGDGYGQGYRIDVLAREIEKVQFGLAWETLLTHQD